MRDHFLALKWSHALCRFPNFALPKPASSLGILCAMQRQKKNLYPTLFCEMETKNNQTNTLLGVERSGGETAKRRGGDSMEEKREEGPGW